MVRWFCYLLLLLLNFGCQQVKEPLSLDELSARAKTGEVAAIEGLVALLGSAGEKTNERVYRTLIELGTESVPALLGRVETDDRVQREYVIAALGNLKAAQAVPGIARVLADGQLKRRYIAAWALGEIGSPAGVEPLIGVLADPDAEVRKYATRSLIKLNRLAIDRLLALLEDGAAGLQAAGAIRALGDIADPRALPVLLTQVAGENRAEAVTALGKLKDRRAEQSLIAALTDADWQVRMNAAMALGPVGTEAAVVPLEGLLEDRVNVVREWSARSLEMVTGKRYRYRNEAGEYVPPYNIYH